jgi:UDP-glucose 4-epimerase
MTKRVLVTGGAGFIGSNVCDVFLSRGWSVDVIDNLSSGRRENLSTDVRLHVADIRSSESGALIRDTAFDVVVHFAAQIDVRQSVNDPVHDANTNVIGVLNLLEAIRARPAGVRPRVVFASTGGAIYGDLGIPPNSETTPKEPDSPYAIAKLATEYYLGYYSRIHGLDAVCLRFGNVYGPRQDPHGEAGVVAIFCGRLLSGSPLTVFGDGGQTRDYVNVIDVAEATYAAATVSLPPALRIDERAFNIGTGVGTSVVDLASTLLHAAGTTAPIEFTAARPGELRHSFLAIDKARDGLGWSPRISLADGLAQTYAWFAARSGAAVSART